MAADLTPDTPDLPDWMAGELAPSADLDLAALLPAGPARPEAPAVRIDLGPTWPGPDLPFGIDTPPPAAELDLAALIPDASASQFDLNLAALIPDLSGAVDPPGFADRREPALMLPEALVHPPAPAEQPAAEPIVYGAVVSLPTRLTALDVAVVHDVPDGLTVLATDPPSLAAKGQLVWSFERIEAGQKMPIWVTARPKAAGWKPPRGPAAFRLTFTSRGSVSLPVARLAMAVEVVGPDAVERGRGGEFEARIRNAGNWPLCGVKVKVIAPPGLDLTAAPPQVAGGHPGRRVGCGAVPAHGRRDG